MFPQVEDPIPDTIGLGLLFSTAGAGGVLCLVFAILLRRSDAQRDAWSRAGIALGLILGLAIYITALLVQLF